MKVRSMRDAFDAERKADNGVFNDAQLFVSHLQQSEAFMRFKADEQGRITSIAWAYQQQKYNAVRYHSVIVQDNTFNTNIYKFHLALIVVVDKENHSQIAMQALLSDERSESFEFVFESFKQLCEGGTPEVVFTDCDAAAMLAIAKVYPSALNKLCIWHTMGNIREHGGGLEKGVLGQVLQLFKAAAYAQTEEYFLQCKGALLDLLPPESKMYEYMEKNIFGTGFRQLVTSSVSCPLSLSRPVTCDRRAGKWASYVHPGLHTLGIASTQRVESMNAAVKKLVTRKGDMVDLGRALLGKVQDDINRTQRRNLGGTVARVAVQGHSYVESFRTKHLRTFNFVLNAVKYEQCSQHATEDTEAQILGALSYEAIPVVRDEEAARRLFEELVADPTKANLTYDTGSGELVDPSIPTSEAAGVSMVSRTSVPHFAELLRDQNVHTVVRITPMSTASECGHLVALGPDGFFLCTCLRQLVYGLLCPHAIKGDAGDPGRGGRGRGGKGSTGRGRAGEKGDPGSSSQGSGGGGNGGRRSGGRGGGTGHGRAGGGVNSAGFATGSPSGTTGVRRASHPPAGSDTTSAAPIGFQAAPVNGAHTSEGLALPFRALDNVDVSRRGGGQASPPFQTTAHLVQLGRLQPPPRKKQTGPSKRHKSSSAP
ncbi:putative far-red impaired response protein [Ectocarpus siliculosus]|uniref:Far-red impaired response protein n=1 Tax=Ectocarpus siliculosus TaxID=2880 RepID=D7G8C7_ECTSI|nr:putative far-red impaired response protein [Ectocarpus siliculosus]|eukprot:CBJ27979.1 putative far-red impaired response protein [Ectocarpus siliculosus]